MLDIRPFTHDDAMVARAGRENRTLHRVYALDEVAVVLGRGSKPELEVFPAAIRDDGVPVYRRRGGGCSVVLDPGNLIVSLAVPLPGIGGITSAFADISALMSGLLADCGVPGVVQRGVSDLAVGDRKLGGSCVHRMRGLLYYSTTLLLEPDLALIDRYLPHPPREPDYRGGRRHGDFVTTLRALGLAVPASGLRELLNRLLQERLAVWPRIR